jgi:hypothetical protein
MDAAAKFNKENHDEAMVLINEHERIRKDEMHVQQEKGENHIKTLEFALKMQDKKLADGLKRTKEAIEKDLEKIKAKRSQGKSNATESNKSAR